MKWASDHSTVSTPLPQNQHIHKSQQVCETTEHLFVHLKCSFVCQTAALGKSSAWLELSPTGAAIPIHRVYLEIRCFDMAFTAHPHNKLKLLFILHTRLCRIFRHKMLWMLKRDLRKVRQIHEGKNPTIAIKHGHPSITNDPWAVTCWSL